MLFLPKASMQNNTVFLLSTCTFQWFVVHAIQKSWNNDIGVLLFKQSSPTAAWGHLVFGVLLTIATTVALIIGQRKVGQKYSLQQK
jgi:hypothetical protein